MDPSRPLTCASHVTRIEGMRFVVHRLLIALAVAFAVTLPTSGARAQSSDAVPRASFDSAWASVSRTYWDTAFVTGTWRPVHDSLRRALGDDADEERVRAAIRALIAVPRQSHFVLIPGSAAPLPVVASMTAPGSATTSVERPGPGTLGFDVRTIGDTVLIWRVDADGPAARAGIGPGDAITHLDTLPLDTALARLRRAAPGDPVAAERLLTAFVKARLGGHVGDSLRLTVVERDRRAHTVVLARAPMPGRPTQFGNLPPFVVSATRDSLPIGRRGARRYAAVIGFSAWFPVISPALDSMLFATRGAAGLILDLRGNPGGVVGMLAGVSGHLIDGATSLGVLHGRGATIRFAANPRRVDRNGTRVDVFAGPVAILVDGSSASTTEFFASGMQAIGRARIFGERSAGMALPALMARLPNGDVLMHVIADHEDPKGRRVEGDGVHPDEVVPLRRSDLRAGRDATLEAARAWIERTTTP